MRSTEVAGPVTAATAAATAAADQLRAALRDATDEALLDGTAAALRLADALTCTALNGVERALTDGTAERVEALPTETLLRLTAGWTTSDARTLCAAAEALRTMPVTAGLFASGTLSWGQVRPVVGGARQLRGADRDALDATVGAVVAAGGSDPDRLLDAVDACVDRLRPEAAARRADGVAERERLQVLGMLNGAGRLFAELEPVGFGEVLEALDAAADRPSADTPRSGQLADAFVRLARSYLGTGPTPADTESPADTDAPAAETPDAAAPAPADTDAPAAETPDTDAPADGPGDAGDAADVPDAADGCAGTGDEGEEDALGAAARYGAADHPAGAWAPVDLDGREAACFLPAPAGTPPVVPVRPVGTPWRARPRVYAQIDLDALCSGRPGPAGTLWLAAARGRVTLTRTDASLLVCQHGIVPLLLAGDGQPVAVGDAEAPIPEPVRRAVHGRDGGCRFPGCAAPVHWADCHHVVWREHGGATSQENLAAICRRHHRQVHQRGWRVTLDRDGTMHFRRGRRTWTTRPRPSPSRASPACHPRPAAATVAATVTAVLPSDADAPLLPF